MEEKVFNNIYCCVCTNTDKEKFSTKYNKDTFIVVECKNCSFNFVPQYFSKQISYEDYKDENVLEQVRGGNDWLKMQRHILRFNFIKRYKKSGKLFDLGVGWGHFLYTGRELGYDVFGIEMAKVPYIYAKQDLKLPVERIDFFDFKIENKTYDIITMWDVLEHIPDADKVIEKCNLMIKDGGYIFIQVPQIDSFIAKLWKDKWRMMSSGHVNYFSKQTMTMLLEKNGFQVLKFKSSFEFKHLLLYGILPKLKNIKTNLTKSKNKYQSGEADKQEFFNKTMRLPKWVLKSFIILHNLIYNIISFAGVGEEMMVVAKKIKP